MEDSKRIIEDGYDRLGPQYRPWSDEAMPDDVRGEYLREALSRLSEGADVLELGFGPGADAAHLAHRHRCTGVDLSSVQLKIARQHVTDGTLLHGDFTAMDFPRDSFNAVVSFLVFNHVPTAEQGRVCLQGRWMTNE